MTVWAIVPVKPLRRGKSRLAGVLSEDERTHLNKFLLDNTLKILSGLDQIEQVLVVSRDPAALALAREHEVRTVREADGPPNLNTALKRATVVAQAYASTGVLVLPADLPLMTRNDILVLLDRARESPVVVIAPDRHEEGTNALLISPPGLIEYDFGPGSYQRHCQHAKVDGVTLDVVRLPALALDSDLPVDLAAIQNTEGWKFDDRPILEETP
ncbi:MAG: 2-phospho-L-lactate guanylyltransferase [Anaerolineae bacterium]|nr:2-phospho-L-lactate guanylyltransferase [Anaerolineae bacterium]